MSEFDIDDTKLVSTSGDVKVAILKTGNSAVRIGAMTYIGPAITMAQNIKAECSLAKRDETIILQMAKDTGAIPVKTEDGVVTK